MEREEVRAYVNAYCELRDVQYAAYELYARRHGLTAKELFVLDILWFEPEGCLQSAICELLSATKQTVSTIIKKFAKQGYVAMEPSETDRRNKIIRFTEAGLRYTEKIIPPAAGAEIDAMAELDFSGEDIADKFDAEKYLNMPRPYPITLGQKMYGYAMPRQFSMLKNAPYVCSSESATPTRRKPCWSRATRMWISSSILADGSERMELKIQEIRVKSVISKSNLPVCDYSVNPYVGCPHACKYCYASFMKQFTGHGEPWGTFPDVKDWQPIHHPEKYRGKDFFVGSVTDPRPSFWTTSATNIRSSCRCTMKSTDTEAAAIGSC